MAEEDEPKPEEVTGCYQWKCQSILCGAGGVFSTYDDAKQEAEGHERETDHKCNIWSC